MTNKTKLEQLEILLEQRQWRQLRAEMAEMNDVDVAQFIESLAPESAVVAFRTLPKAAEMDVFAELDSATQQHIIKSITDKEIADIMKDLWVDDAVDMLEEMPATLVKRVLQNAAPETRALINEFLRYPEYSAGSIMTAEYVSLKKGMTVEDAIKRIRRTAEDRETIYTCYVVDSTRVLQGVVTVKDLLLAADGQLVGEIMEPGVISVGTTEDQEAAAKLMAKYGLIALPVVDAERRLVGIVTVDDAVDVIREEDTEDFEKMAGMTPSEKPYLKTGVFALARNRFPWLVVLMVGNMFTGMILGHYAPMYALAPVLVTFVPMITGTGGNAGSQSSTIVIRGMALGEISMRDWAAVLWKELRVCLLVGLVLGLVNYARIVLFYDTSPLLDTGLLALSVSLAVVGAVFVGKTVGSMLPMLAKACRIDPAVVAAPLITTIVDVLALALYFEVAMRVLGLSLG